MADAAKWQKDTLDSYVAQLKAKANRIADAVYEAEKVLDMACVCVGVGEGGEGRCRIHSGLT